MTSPADELRAAAQTLRARALAASTDPDGTPTAHWHSKPCWPDDDGNHVLYGDYLTRDDGRRISWPLLHRGGSQHRPTYMATQHAAYAATMGPTVGLALAAWLEQAADAVAGQPVPDDNPALAVARAITRRTGA